jgi:hypothetical protein
MSLFGKKDSAQPRPGNDVGANGSAGGYGIAQAIGLMRSLPVDQNVELVVRVVRNTLESMNVQLPAIIDDALAKEAGLQDRIETLDGEIEALAEQIDLRRHEIVRLQAELKETTTVKDRLLLAQKLGTGGAHNGATPPALPAAPIKLPDKGQPELRAAAAR